MVLLFFLSMVVILRYIDAPGAEQEEDAAPGCAAGKLCNGRSCGNGGEERVHFPALPSGGEKPPVAHKTELLPGGERFRRSPHRFKAGFQRRVVFAVARGVDAAWRAPRLCRVRPRDTGRGRIPPSGTRRPPEAGS